MEDFLLAQREILQRHWREEHGDTKPRLTREERRLLDEKRAALSPETLAELKASGWDDMFDLEEYEEDREK